MYATAIAGLEIAQPCAGAAGDELSGFHPTRFAHHLDESDGNAEWIAGRVAANLIQNYGAVHSKRDLELA